MLKPPKILTISPPMKFLVMMRRRPPQKMFTSSRREADDSDQLFSCDEPGHEFAAFRQASRESWYEFAVAGLGLTGGGGESRPGGGVGGGGPGGGPYLDPSRSYFRAIKRMPTQIRKTGQTVSKRM